MGGIIIIGMGCFNLESHFLRVQNKQVTVKVVPHIMKPTQGGGKRVLASMRACAALES